MSKKPSPKIFEETLEIKKVKSTTNQTKKPKKRDWSFYAIIICIVALAVPAGIFATTMLSASMASRKPQFGDRFENEFDKVIEKENITAVQKAVSEIEGVKKAAVELISGTMRIYVDAGESAKDAYEGLAQSSYDALASILPIETYFTEDETYHRYDLEIHVYNMIKPSEEEKPNFIYYTLTKTSMHEKPLTQFVTDPLSQEFVDELWEIQAERDKPKEPEVEDVEPEVPTEEEMEGNVD